MERREESEDQRLESSAYENPTTSHDVAQFFACLGVSAGAPVSLAGKGLSYKLGYRDGALAETRIIDSLATASEVPHAAT